MLPKICVWWCCNWFLFFIILLQYIWLNDLLWNFIVLIIMVLDNETLQVFSQSFIFFINQRFNSYALIYHLSEHGQCLNYVLRDFKASDQISSRTQHENNMIWMSQSMFKNSTMIFPLNNIILFKVDKPSSLIFHILSKNSFFINFYHQHKKTIQMKITFLQKSTLCL